MNELFSVERYVPQKDPVSKARPSPVFFVELPLINDSMTNAERFPRINFPFNHDLLRKTTSNWWYEKTRAKKYPWNTSRRSRNSNLCSWMITSRMNNLRPHSKKRGATATPHQRVVLNVRRTVDIWTRFQVYQTTRPAEIKKVWVFYPTAPSFWFKKCFSLFFFSSSSPPFSSFFDVRTICRADSCYAKNLQFVAHSERERTGNGSTPKAWVSSSCSSGAT